MKKWKNAFVIGLTELTNNKSEMNGEQIIPPITDPSGQSWKQPHRRYIELDKTHALMSEQTFKGLPEYSYTIPTGKSYPHLTLIVTLIVTLIPVTMMNKGIKAIYESMRVKCGEPINMANGILHGTDQPQNPATYLSNGEKY